jgi:hypothetical protein
MATRAEIEKALNDYLAGISALDRPTRTMVLCDRQNNMPEDIAQGRLNAELFVWPTSDEQWRAMVAAGWTSVIWQ